MTTLAQQPRADLETEVERARSCFIETRATLARRLLCQRKRIFGAVLWQSALAGGHSCESDLVGNGSRNA